MALKFPVVFVAQSIHTHFAALSVPVVLERRAPARMLYCTRIKCAVIDKTCSLVVYSKH